MAEYLSTEESSGTSRIYSNRSFYLVAGLVFTVSAAVTVYYCRSMSGGMEMPGGWTMSMMWMRMPGQTWLASATMFLLMWVAMMVVMMLPAALPMLMSFHRCHSDRSDRHTGLSTAMVAGGYLTVWATLGILTYGLGVMWANATMQWSSLSRAVPTLTGATVALAGLFQFSRWKMYGLGRCRHPAVCSATAKESGKLAGYAYGINQGLCCAICCLGPMTILLALGMMNSLLMIGVTVVISLEKLLANPFPVVRLVGLMAVVTGMAGMIRTVV